MRTQWLLRPHTLGVLLSFALGACSGNMGGPSPLPGDSTDNAGPTSAILWDESLTELLGRDIFETGGFGYSFHYSDGITSRGKLTATLTYTPADTAIEMLMARTTASFPCNLPLPPQCSRVGGIEASGGEVVLVIDPLEELPIPNDPLDFDPNEVVYSLWIEAKAPADAHLRVVFEPDPNAPRPPAMGFAWDLNATLGATCNAQEVSGPFQLVVDQTGVFLFAFLADAGGDLVGRVDVDGAFELTGEIMEAGGPTTPLTLTGRVTGSSMSGNFTREWPGGCVSSGTFSGNRS